MPTDITNLDNCNIEQRLLSFRKKIKDGQGWSVEELVKEMGVSDTAMILLMKKYGIRRRMANSARMRWFLVNEKTHAKIHANRH